MVITYNELPIGNIELSIGLFVLTILKFAYISKNSILESKSRTPKSK